MMNGSTPLPRKRRRMTEEGSISSLLEQGQWENALLLVKSKPELVAASLDPSPLALACRSGAPYDCIRALLEAAPTRLRRLLDSRGTPLHEAVVCENTETRVIELLLKKDEELGSENTRATLLQDVDGFTPLHLLIRRRFQTHILQSDTSLMQILEMLVRSCPDAVVVPDRGEYEEPPIVYAIKANIYAPSLGSEDATLVRVERQIYEMVDLMLRYNPSAASRVFDGFRGQYTALHSAVFHGRFTSTIGLILRAEAQSTPKPKAALMQNTQGEMPLHFCAMRGEIPSSVALIANAAPEAVSKRDTSGLTPFHWLWIRFVSTLLTLEEGGRGTDSTIQLRAHRPTPGTENTYKDFAIMEQGDFDADLELIKRMDPAVDFLRMRHIPVEVVGGADGLRRASRSVEILKRIRERHRDLLEQPEDTEVEWTREEAVTALFWNKVVSLLQATNRVSQEPIRGDSVLVHIAFSSKCCLPAVAHMVALMYPEELTLPDEMGRIPLHYAARREWDRWDVPSEDSEPTASQLLHGDSIGVLKVALALSPPRAMRVTDTEDRLVLHHVIDSMLSASCVRTNPEMLEVVRELVRLHPEALQHRDSRSFFYPFLQASLVGCPEKEELSISFSYEFLRETPALLAAIRR